MIKKICIAIAIIIIYFPALNAQNPDTNRTSFAILGGVNYQNLNGDDYFGDKLENDPLLGFHAGVNVQFPISTGFYIQPGIQFVQKGAKYSNDLSSGNFKISYVEVPVNFVYKANVGTGFFNLGFGPYVGYGISGKTHSETGNISLDSDVEFKSVVEASDPLTTAYLKRLDMGANIFFGYELNGGLFIQLDAQLGLVNINPEDKRLLDDQSSVKNTGFGLSLGYRF
ncbi:MAG: PorT family protein [Saprospiraceae bacterium]|nr:PorT family protein [Saprospiraceae bacterium]